MKAKKVRFLTLGCRLNQYETQSMLEDLSRHGYQAVSAKERADIYVINTCTVTAESDKKSRYLIRRCFHENPKADIVVTGCYAERDQEAIASICGVSHVVFNRQKSDLVSLLGEKNSKSTDGRDVVSMPPKSKYVPLQISNFAGRTRAYIKIQDGCNHACSFCKVVLVRGKSRSRLAKDIVEEAVRLRDHGYQEVVLTGIQLGAYGLDLQPAMRLQDVLEALQRIDGIRRIRLSSIEPMDVTDGLIETMRCLPKACHHLHIPLQSGANEILKEMNRRTSREYFLELVQKLNQQLNDFVLTSDVLVGFPGETDEHFQETVDILKMTQPYKLHIFPFSPREGTRAFRLKTLPQLVIKKRKNILLQLDQELRKNVQQHFLGATMDVMIEAKIKNSQWMEGHTSNFLKVRTAASKDVGSGALLPVRIDGMENNFLIGSASN